VARYGVVLFFTSSSAMQAEAVLLKGGLTVKLIPTPGEFSSDCGLSLRFEWVRNEKVRSLLEKCHLEIAEVHALS
jgi:hypothetical protein